MIKQTITVELQLDPGQEPYNFNEGRNGKTYIALEAFFKDLGYIVLAYGSRVITTPDILRPEIAPPWDEDSIL